MSQPKENKAMLPMNESEITGSYEFAYEIAELRSVWATYEKTLSRDYTIVTWAAARGMTNDFGAVRCIASTVDRIIEAGSVDKFWDRPSDVIRVITKTKT